MISVRLSPAQHEYLLQASLLPTDIREAVAASAPAPPSDKTTIEFDAVDAERVRSALTNRLAKVGFDADYEPTDEGALLEDLIDSFHSGTE